MDTQPTLKKIFISHASKDSEIVNVFIDKILNLGLNIDPNDIAYTSRTETGVTNGDSIVQYIKDNISNCDFVFFIISENYRNSEVCLNEMGAAWATNRTIKILLLPDVGFESIGWLYGVTKGDKINESDALDAIYDDFSEKYNSKIKLTSWNRNKSEFIEFVNSKVCANLPAIIESADIDDDESDMGLLDYRIKFDENNTIFIETMGELTAETTQYSESLNKRTSQLTTLNSNPHPNMHQIRGVMMAVANDMNKMADTIDIHDPKLRQYFAKTIEYAVKMHHSGANDPVNVEENRKAIIELTNAITVVKNAIIEGRRALIEIQSLEQSQNKAKKRLVKCYDNLISTFDYCISQTNELIKL